MDFGNINKKDAIIAVAIVVGGALLVLLMRHQSKATAANGLGPSSGANALVGGYGTASTVYVPTSSYDIHYDTNNGTIIHGTTAGGQPSTTYTTPSGGMVHTPAPSEPTSTQSTSPYPTATPTNPAPAPSPHGTFVTTSSFTMDLPSTLTPTQIHGIASEPNTNIVHMPSGGYVVSQGGASYNNATSGAGGQYINHQWVAGHYSPGGTFIAANAQAASIYNQYEQSRGSSARAQVG